MLLNKIHMFNAGVIMQLLNNLSDIVCLNLYAESHRGDKLRYSLDRESERYHSVTQCILGH